jgi:lipopolysaccharide heptosyltransferase III
VVPKNLNILVINVARIGDTLLIAPVLRAIKAACPEGRLGCLAHPKRAALLEGLSGLDFLGTITPRRARFRGRFGGKRWDYAIVYGRDAALIRYAARVAHRVIAFAQEHDDVNRLLWRAVPVPADRERLHVVHEHLLLPAALGMETTDYRLAYAPSAAELGRAREWLSRRLPPGAHPLVGFQVASFATKSYRDWPLERFAELGEKILADFPSARILILGGKDCRGHARRLQARLGDRAVAAAGRFDLRGTAALMRHLDLYVGVDTGPTHLAGALNVPMVALYHCFHRARRLAPLGHPRLRAIDHPRADGACDREVPMDEITLETVWAQVKDLLHRGPVEKTAAAAEAGP